MLVLRALESVNNLIWPRSIIPRMALSLNGTAKDSLQAEKILNWAIVYKYALDFYMSNIHTGLGWWNNAHYSCKIGLFFYEPSEPSEAAELETRKPEETF